MFNTLTRMGAAGAGSAYEIDRSLRFHSSDSTKLTRTFGTNSSDTTKTLSFWMKRGSLGTYQKPFATTTSGYIEGYIRINDDDSLQYEDRDSSSGSTDGRLVTNRRFKDVSAWYHIVLTIDTTNGTAGDRVRIYVNGVRETSFSSTTNPASSYASQFFRSSVDNFIGAGDVYFDGYLAEIHFVDGTALDSSSFGETDADTGQWIPKEYTGSHGTNGFYLNFSDNSNTTAGTLGADSSANSNNWTPTNLSVSAGKDDDSMLDTPTNNFPTLNQLDRSLVGTISNGNLRVSYNYKPATKNFRGTMALPTTGKFYWEWENEEASSNPGRWQTGLVRYTEEAGVLDSDGNNDDNYFTVSYGGSVWVGATNVTDPSNGWSSWPTFYSGERVAIAIDCSNGKVWVGKVASGGGTTWYAADSGTDGNPAAGTNEMGTLPNWGTGKWMPVIIWHDGGAPVTTTFTSNINFGNHSFLGTPPTGFKTLSSANLAVPTIKKPSDYFNTVLYTGNDSDGHAITGVGFQPDFVWIKDRGDGNKHRLYDDLRGVNAALHTDDDSAEDQYATYGQFESFDSDGFTVGIGTGDASQRGEGTNSAEPHVAWCWKESATAGFDMVAYTGTGANADISHSLGVAPEAMFIKDRDTTDDWRVWWNGVTDSNDKYLTIQGTNALISGGSAKWNGAPTSSVFKVTSDGSLNRSNDDYIAYLFASVSGHSKVGTYIGNGSQDGPYIYTDFKPAWVLVKNTEEVSVWNLHDNKRDPYNIVNKVLYPSEPDDEEAYAVGTASSTNKLFLSNGFKIWSTHDPELNASGEKYIYLAFAERPFKYANAR